MRGGGGGGICDRGYKLFEKEGEIESYLRSPPPSSSDFVSFMFVSFCLIISFR